MNKDLEISNNANMLNIIDVAKKLNINENEDVMQKVENSIGIMIDENKKDIIKDICGYILKSI